MSVRYTDRFWAPPSMPENVAVRPWKMLGDRTRHKEKVDLFGSGADNRRALVSSRNGDGTRRLRLIAWPFGYGEYTDRLSTKRLLCLHTSLLSWIFMTARALP